jgi:hypothetical protein
MEHSEDLAAHCSGRNDAKCTPISAGDDTVYGAVPGKKNLSKEGDFRPPLKTNVRNANHMGIAYGSMSRQPVPLREWACMMRASSLAAQTISSPALTRQSTSSFVTLSVP